MEASNGESAQSQGTVQMRKRAGPESSDAAMKRQRKEKKSDCYPVHGMRKKLKPSVPTFPVGLMQASDLESPRMETHVGVAT